MLKRFFHICVLVLLLNACGSREAQRLLDQAEAVINENSSEAITIIDSISNDGLSHSQRMRRLLLLTNAQNKCDTVFRSDSIQRLLVDYYDRHGSANEKMLAYYLLGRARYDMGEVPAALESFQDAASCADTVSSDCDYQLLCRIHGQTARLFLEQEAPDNAIQEIDKIAKYAMLVKDTAMWLVNEGQRANAYYMLGNEDSLLFIYKKIHDEWRIIGNDAYASMAQVPAVVILLDRGEVKKAGMMLAEYESKSGAVNANHDVAKGNEIFYYIKGRYYAEAGKTDSAFMFYRKALSTCTKADEKAAICYHLASLYEKAGNKDSSSSYWKRSYVELDTAHLQKGTEKLQRLKATYDFTYHKHLAEQKENDAYRNRNAAIFFGMLLLLCLLAVYIIVLHIKRYKREADEREKQLQSRLAELEETTVMESIAHREALLMESEIRMRFKRMLEDKSHPMPSYQDMKELRLYIAEVVPNFYVFLNTCNLTQEEMDICILTRLHFQPAQIHQFTGLTVAYISVIRKRLHQKIFHSAEGGARDFDKKIRNL
jgi:tetratricopeptide (TPR) repeat protein